VHVDGATARSTKRLVRRLPYVSNPVSGVQLETAGLVDLDVEIKFNVGNEAYSIDVSKKELPALIPFYKALVAISDHCARAGRRNELAHLALNTAAVATSGKGGDGKAAAGEGGAPAPAALAANAAFAYDWLLQQHAANNPPSLMHIFREHLRG
jgi:hypothetical protein